MALVNLKTIERGEVKKDSPIAGETRIDDVAIIYNRWIKSKAEIRTIAPVQYPSYCMGYESLFILSCILLCIGKWQLRRPTNILMEIQMVMCFFATLFYTVGMLINKDFKVSFHRLTQSALELIRTLT